MRAPTLRFAPTAICLVLLTSCGHRPAAEAPAASTRVSPQNVDHSVQVASPPPPPPPVMEQKRERASRRPNTEANAATSTEAAPVAEIAVAAGVALGRAADMAYAKSVAAPSVAMMAPMPIAPIAAEPSTEQYAAITRNGVQRTAEQALSTFSADVDTGSYSNVRRMLQQGQLPPTDAVRLEEMVNYFRVAEQGPPKAGQPFAVHAEIAPSPWGAGRQLMRISLQGYAPSEPPPAANLVFLVDTSGSMHAPNKLPLVQQSLKLLVQHLREQDRISVVTYAGHTEVVLPPTPGNQRAAIAMAIDRIAAGGGTNGGAGIQLAYAQAKAGFIKGGNNRVLLATDGDFNLGVTRFETLKDMVRNARQSGVALTTLGFGEGNYNDQLMEQLADIGNGNYAYIDGLQEAKKVLVDQRDATLMTIASDVKLQLEFNPRTVTEYRLLGYENRALRSEDFANDTVDAGEIGAGHRVTALYEVALAGEGGERLPRMRYQDDKPLNATPTSGEFAELRLRYKLPGQATSQQITRVITKADQRASLAGSSAAMQLAVAAAGFAQKLSQDTALGDWSWGALQGLARSGMRADGGEDSAELVKLIELAASLSAQHGDAEGAGAD